MLALAKMEHTEERGDAGEPAPESESDADRDSAECTGDLDPTEESSQPLKKKQRMHDKQQSRDQETAEPNEEFFSDGDSDQGAIPPFSWLFLRISGRDVLPLLRHLPKVKTMRYATRG